jgi:NodT family efflux transporter outer membrane factor (OMF) lipoprotein
MSRLCGKTARGRRRQALLPFAARPGLAAARGARYSRGVTAFRPVSSLLLAAALTGCMVGPDYHVPPAQVSRVFKEAASPLPGWQKAQPQDAAVKGPWWAVFDDSVLDGLERRVDAGNQTLAQQEAAYRNAQALVTEARAGLFPTLTANGSAALGATGRGPTTNSGALEGGLNWEIDLWGQIRRQVQGNVALAQASAAEIANARLSAQATIASAYVELRISDALRRVLDAAVSFDQRALAITQNQYAAGFAARGDVITAQTQLDAAQSSAVSVGVARAEYEHAIAVQIGVPPAALTIVAQTRPMVLPAIPVTLPAALLQRRPDIAAAERIMAADNAAIGVAVAAFYPQLSLSALYGFSGNPIGSLISAGNRVWSLGAAATETLFEGGARTAQVQAARATYDGAVASYRQTVLTAFQQVEDQLSTLRILAQQAVIQDRAVADASQAVSIALNEYRAGTQAYTTVITAQTTRLIAQETALSIQQSRLVAAVTLIEALGGGWSAADLPSGPSLQTVNPLLP